MKDHIKSSHRRSMFHYEGGGFICWLHAGIHEDHIARHAYGARWFFPYVQQGITVGGGGGWHACRWDPQAVFLLLVCETNSSNGALHIRILGSALRVCVGGVRSRF
jgi:hypothetical protein